MNGKSATLLVLVLAAVVLGCFAVKSYFDFQVTKLKHEYEQQGGKPPSAQQASVGTAGAIPPPPGVGAAPLPGTVAAAPPIAPAPVPSPIPGASTLADAVENSEVAKMKAELDALRRETDLMNSRASQAAGGSPSAAGSSPPAPPAFVPVAAPGTLGGATPLPSDDPKVQALRQQILNASAIGKVAAFHREFDRVTIVGGTERNIQVDDTFAVRRGHEIMGFLTIEEVEQGTAHAKLTSSNAGSETARKPQTGDDVIKWPLF